MAGLVPQNIAQRDASARAEGILDLVLEETSEVTQLERANESAVAAELRKQRILAAESKRVKSRVLFVTSNRGVLSNDDIAQRNILDLQDVFDEIHVLVIGKSGTSSQETVRLAPRVFAHSFSSYFFWYIPFAAVRIAKEELQFGDGFRADLIVALEPFEAAAAAYAIAEHFERPWQVHVRDDSFLNEKKFLAADKYNARRLRFMRRTLRRAKSVRVSTDLLKNVLQKRFKRIADIALLPRFFHTEQLLALPVKPETDVFPQFSFTIMFIGELNTESTLFRTLDATRVVLQTPSIGLVVIGDGPQKPLFKARAGILGIERQVLFLGGIADYIAQLRSADVLLVTDTNTASDDLVIKAAALGVPLIMARTPLRQDLFQDGVHAYVCEADNTLEYLTKLRNFLNTNALRTQFSVNGREVIRTRIEEDPQLYRIAYRDSIEQVLYAVVAQDKVAAETSEKQAVLAAPAATSVMVDGLEMKVPEGMRE